MGSYRNCSVFGCAMNYAKARKQGKVIHFYAFPSRSWMTQRRATWIRFVKRKGINGKPWEPTKWSLICSQHFVGGAKSEDPRSPSFNPSIFSVTDVNQIKSKQDRYERLLRRVTVLNKVDQKYNAPSQNLNNAHEEPGVPSAISGNNEEGNAADIDIHLNDEPQDEQVALSNNSTSFEIDFPTEYQHDLSQNPLSRNNEQQPQLPLSAAYGPDTRSVYFGGFSSVNVHGSLKSMTGVTDNVFSLLMSLFPNFVPQRTEISLEDKLLLTLFKLKTGLIFVNVGSIFGITPAMAAKIFYTTMAHLKAVTKSWIFLPSQDAVRATLPSSFKQKYSNCRIIIDCTEFRIQTPPTIEQKVHMYSTYKSSYTAKYLVAITPNGFIAFISKGYGGRSTDSFITNDSGILNLLEDGDIVMADKGFPLVQIKDGTVLVMPPFSRRNQNQFTAEEMDQTYEIASVRIHVERAIQRIKTFDILTKTISIKLLPHLDDIIHVICILVNLSTPIL